LPPSVWLEAVALFYGRVVTVRILQTAVSMSDGTAKNNFEKDYGITGHTGN
jgi:hypothetical protein